MTTLHLGVNDIPYADQKGVTTHQVAQWLENRYHPMEVFSEIKHDMIVGAITDSLTDAIDGLLMGAPLSLDAFGAATSQIEAEFKSWLSLHGLDNLGIPGLPTKAAQDGVSSRFKRRRGPPRPSLIDSGLYQANFRAWVD